jgi:hypothetical protein
MFTVNVCKEKSFTVSCFTVKVVRSQLRIHNFDCEQRPIAWWARQV